MVLFYEDTRLEMIIAHVCPYSPSRVIGGVARTVYELATRQAKMGHKVHVFCSDFDKSKRIEIEEEVADNITIHYCHYYFRVSSFSTAWPAVYWKLLKLKPNLIHVHIVNHLHSYLSMRAAKKLSVPIVVNCHCPWGSKRSLAGRFFNYISMNFFPILSKCNAVISITEWERKFLLAEGVKPKDIYTIPNGMSKEFFNRIEPNKFKEKHNIPLNHKIVLFFGRLNYTKNPLGFLTIAEAVLDKREDVTFVICGPNEGEFPKVKEKIDSLYHRIKKNIRLLPPTRDRKDIIEMYQASDIYLLPSRREGLPLTLFEAYASGLPVICSAVNGLLYEMKDNENGFLLLPNDLKGFINNTNFLLDGESIRLQMRANNLEKAKNYDWDLISKETLKIYYSLVTPQHL